MTHENAEDLTANVLVGRSVRHRSTVEFARHLSYDRTATVDKIAQPILADLHSNLRGARAPPRPKRAQERMSAFGTKQTLVCVASKSALEVGAGRDRI